MSYLGVDIGTSGCKAVVFADDGTQLSGAHRGYEIKTPQPGWAELDPREVMDACCAVIAEAAREAAGDPVRALAISSQGEAFTPVDAEGRYLGGALVSSDTRATDEVARFVESFGRDRLYQITGHTASPMFSLFKLLWVQTNLPEIWQQRPRFLCFEDLLQHRLGVDPAMGWPLAGRTMLFDVQLHCWSLEILEALDLQESQLARPLASGSVAGIVAESVAKELGLPAGVKVVTGGHDQTIAALGAGVVEPGTAIYAAGTVECLCPIIPRLTLTDELCCNNLCCYDYSLPGQYTSVAYSLTGSNLLQYFREQFAADLSYEQLLAEMPNTPSTMMALPYFTPSGTPYFDQETAGTVLGWRLSSSRGDLLKGLMESIAFEMKLNLSLLEDAGININRLIATGGGARNERLVQLKADVLGKPIEKMEIDEAGCYGAARLAQSADQSVTVNELVRTANRARKLITPDPPRTAQYERTFEQYKVMYDTMKDLYARLGRMG